MSDDPETVRQIEELSRDSRPLLVCDIDEVVLEFVRPFIGFLNAQGLHLKTDSFRLHGNVVDLESGTAVEAAGVTNLIEGFYAAQEEWQSAVEGAAECLNRLSHGAEIVLLTAMPHRHRGAAPGAPRQAGISVPVVDDGNPERAGNSTPSRRYRPTGPRLSTTFRATWFPFAIRSPNPAWYT